MQRFNAADPDERRARGPQSLAEDQLLLLEMNRHTPRRSNLYSSTLAHHAVEINIALLDQAGSLKHSPRTSTAQHIRAFLAAMATMAFQ